MTPWKRKEVIGGCTLYLGDCMALLPDVGLADAVVTDPPYGIGASGGVGKYGRQKFQKSDKKWDGTAISAPVVGALRDAAPIQIIWGGNYFDLPPSRGFLVWDKGNGFKGRDFAECEFAWTSMDMNARVLSYDPLARGDYKNKVHPTQKPVDVMSWCLGFLPVNGGGTVLDPFMGSGSTGVACIRRGFSFVGIELDPEYFDIACRRIRDAYLQADMFAPAAPAPSQATQVDMFSKGGAS